MRKNIIKFSALSLALILSLNGCSGIEININSGNKEDVENTSGLNVEKDSSNINSNNTIKLSDLKNKYMENTSFIDDVKKLSPMYNVDPEAVFTFHFKSKVDPFKCVSVHTDEKCELNSKLDVWNTGYFTEDGGVDIIVNGAGEKATFKNVLNCKDRLDYIETDKTWGNAQIYYIKINYDLESKEPKKLETPIIIPFTIKKDVKTPLLTYKISKDGDFLLKWEDTKADKYRIYKIYNRNREEEDNYTFLNRERAYIGLNAELLDEVSGDTTEYNLSKFDEDSSKYTHTQNDNMLKSSSYDYMVTAVQDNKESNFSNEIVSGRWSNQLPYKVMQKEFRLTYEVLDELPYTVDIQMADRETIKSLPVNYKLIDDDYVNTEHYVEYEYEISGTRLKGKVKLKVNDDDTYEDIVKSPILVDYTMYNTNFDPISVSSSEITALNGIDASDIDLTKIKEYNQLSRIIYDYDALQIKIDLHMTRMLTNGVYNDALLESEEIDVVDYNNEQNNLEWRKETYGDIFSVAGNTESDKITSDNIIESKIKEDEQKESEYDSINLTVNDAFMYKADFLEEEYLAINLINQEEKIRIDNLPSLMDPNILWDVVLKVKYQNPYFMGFNDVSIEQDSLTGAIYLVPDYAYSKDESLRMQNEISLEATRVINEIIKPGMTDKEKIEAIWDYLEDNTQYDQECLDNVASYNYEYSDPKYEYAFNTYGIMCKKLGVCMSYAYTTDLLCHLAGLDSLVLVGYGSSGVGHAWNAIELDGKWYWFDATNTYDATLVEHYVYLTSSDFAMDCGYKLDDGYELDHRLNTVLNDDNSQDWYYENELVANNDSEFIEAISRSYKLSKEKGNITLAVRVTYDIDVNDEDLLAKTLQKLIDSGLTESELKKLSLPVYWKPYVVMVTDLDEFQKSLDSTYQQ